MEERTGLELPKSNSLIVVGQLVRPSDPPHAYYFDERGRPANRETHRRLQNEMSELLFVMDGRLRPRVEALPLTNLPRDWNRTLHAFGLGARSAAGTNADSYARRRSPVRMPLSAAKRFFAKRLAVLFDRDPKDLLVARFSEYLSRDGDWHIGEQDPSLQSFWKDLAMNRWKIPYLRRLESISFMRSGAPWSLANKQEPFRVEFKTSLGTYTFAFPNWPKAALLRAKVARRFVLAAAFAYQCRPGNKEMAALVWKAGRYMEKPVALLHRRLTLDAVSTHFGLTPRQVRYAAQKLPKRISSTTAG